MMMFGDNAKKVQSIILEFKKIRNDLLDQEFGPEIKGIDGLTKVWLLIDIAESFIIPTATEEELFDIINDAYNETRGIEKFIFYSQALELEKSEGFKNLKIVTEKRTRLLNELKGSV